MVFGVLVNDCAHLSRLSSRSPTLVRFTLQWGWRKFGSSRSVSPTASSEETSRPATTQDAILLIARGDGSRLRRGPHGVGLCRPRRSRAPHRPYLVPVNLPGSRRPCEPRPSSAALHGGGPGATPSPQSLVSSKRTAPGRLCIVPAPPVMFGSLGKRRLKDTRRRQKIRAPIGHRIVHKHILRTVASLIRTLPLSRHARVDPPHPGELHAGASLTQLGGEIASSLASRLLPILSSAAPRKYWAGNQGLFQRG